VVQFWGSDGFEICAGEVAKVGFGGGIVSFRGGEFGFECAKMDSFAKDGNFGGPCVRDCLVNAFIF